MLGGPDSFADGQVRPHARRRAPAGLPERAPAAAAEPTGRSIGWCSPARAGSSPGSGRGRPRTRNRSGWPRCPVPDPQPRGQHQAGGRGRSPRSATPTGNDRPRARGAAVRQGARRGPPDRRPLALGHAAREPDGERPRALLAADRPLARRRRPQPGRGLRPPQGRRARRRPSSSRSACATPSTGRSTTPRSPSRSPCRTEATITLDAEPDGREAGLYAATYVAKQPGAYRVVATATAPDGSAVGEREAGWAAQPAADEFARLEPDREFLETLASKTGGEVVDGDGLDSFVAGLSSRKAPITEPWTSPLWHHPLYFLIAIACLSAEWGLRRVNGLA